MTREREREAGIVETSYNTHNGRGEAILARERDSNKGGGGWKKKSMRSSELLRPSGVTIPNQLVPLRKWKWLSFLDRLDDEAYAKTARAERDQYGSSFR